MTQDAEDEAFSAASPSSKLMITSENSQSTRRIAVKLGSIGKLKTRKMLREGLTYNEKGQPLNM
jgi:hypothetical protein